ncbi:MAG TPA: type VI secretion protein VasK, partial [Buttiauxella sp.]
MTQSKILPNARYGSWGYFLLVIGLAGISAFLLFINQESLNSLGVSTQKIWTIWGGIFAALLFGLIVPPVWWRWKQRKNQAVYKPQAPGASATLIDSSDIDQSFTSLKKHLRTRYSFFWRSKIRLLLVVGDEVSIANVLPALKALGWLEGSRTVLIYGGSLSEPLEQPKLNALRKVRRGRPLDGIVRVIGKEQKLTRQVSDSDLRGLEKIGEALRYQPPVWLWQLCDSAWPQQGRKLQPVGVALPVKAMPEEVVAQLDKLLPQLREQGLSQIAENPSYDFLLRLAQNLAQGGSESWKERLRPWLYSSQQRVPLRGLMFSLETRSEPAGADFGNTVPATHNHALTVPAAWQGVINDCAHVRGRRVGMAWEQTLAWA